MEYLASGFENVDGAADVERYATCLQLLHSMEFFRDYKSKSMDLLDLNADSKVLDLGCGTGEDAVCMSKMLEPRGEVIGVDSSYAMLERAKATALGASALVHFQVADALALPFEAEVFDRSRVDRTLQHIADPDQAISELVRVTKPGGIIVAFDNDWESFAFSSQNRRVTREVANLWCDSFPSGWIGRRLYGSFRRAGLVEVQVFPRTLVITDLRRADVVYDLFQTIERATTIGRVSERDGQELIHELKELDSAGQFFCSYTGFLVVGRKPTSGTGCS